MKTLPGNYYWHVGRIYHSFDLNTVRKEVGQYLEIPEGRFSSLCNYGFHGSPLLYYALSYSVDSTIEIRELYNIREYDSDKVVADSMQIVGLISDASEILHEYAMEVLWERYELLEESITSLDLKLIKECIEFIDENISNIDYRGVRNVYLEKLGRFAAISPADSIDPFVNFLMAIIGQWHCRPYLSPFRTIRTLSNSLGKEEIIIDKNYILEEKILKEMKYLDGREIEHGSF